MHPEPVISANDVIPPFVAEGHISTRSFTSNPDLNHASEANVFFVSSNGWWQVEAKYLNPPHGAPRIENCMNIPEGTRSFTLFEGITNTGTVGVEACGTGFPPPARTELFVSWLSLSPHPLLPLIDSECAGFLIKSIRPSARPEHLFVPTMRQTIVDYRFANAIIYGSTNAF